MDMSATLTVELALGLVSVILLPVTGGAKYTLLFAKPFRGFQLVQERVLYVLDHGCLGGVVEDSGKALLLAKNISSPPINGDVLGSFLSCPVGLHTEHLVPFSSFWRFWQAEP